MMAAPIVIALILLAMHGYMGTHVVRRGVIFVDIALAQVAAFGVAMSMWLGAELHSTQTFFIGLFSAFVGAVMLSFTRSKDKRVPQEAYIGIVYVVFSAAMILVLSQVAHGSEEIKHLLVGAILWVTWPIVLKTFLLYGVICLLLLKWHKPFSRISIDACKAQQEGLSLRLWDFLFYMVLGTVVTVSVQIAGVLMVFTLLVVPTVMSIRLFEKSSYQFYYILGAGTITVISGSSMSYLLDLPTGASIVCAFGLFLTVQIIIEGILRK